MQLPNLPMARDNYQSQVATIYKLLGYNVTDNVNIDGQNIDLLCEGQTPGAGKVVLCIKCKYFEGDNQNNISSDEVNAFIANFHALKYTQGWTAGVIVSNKKFNQSAYVIADLHPDISLKTIDDLYDDLFQIRPYLQSCIATYEADKVLADYIPLNTTLGSNSQLTTNKSDLKEIFYKWISLPDNPQLCLLGDFGAGKTTFLQYIHNECALGFLSGTFERMPLFLTLRDYYDTRDGKELIERFLSQELATKVPYYIFENSLKAGRFLLLFDGFDEMGVVSDVSIRRMNYLKLCHFITPNTKMVISCRPTYFVSHQELLDVFGLYKREIRIPTPITRGDKHLTKDYEDLSVQLDITTNTIQLDHLHNAIKLLSQNLELANIQLFDEAQIKAYLAFHNKDIIQASKGYFDDKLLFAFIRQIYDLEDLAERPILLKLIVTTLPDFRQNKSGKYIVQFDDGVREFDEINPSLLYYQYTEKEFKREYLKGEVRGQIDHNDRREIISHLAFHMFENNTQIINPDEFSTIINTFFPFQDEEKLEQIITDIRTCSFLVLDRSNNLRYAHKSFMEYYTAQYLIDLLGREGKGRKPRQNQNIAEEVLSRFLLPREILYFLGDLIRTFYPFLIKVLNDMLPDRNGINDICKYNAFNLLNYARYPRTLVENIDIEGLLYIKQELHSLSLDKCRLNTLSFNYTRVNQLTISNSIIEELEQKGAMIHRLTLNSCEIRSFDCDGSTMQGQITDSYLNNFQLFNTALNQVTFANNTIIASSCAESELKDVKFKQILFMANNSQHIKLCEMENVSFENCIFLYLDFDDNFLHKAVFKRCLFLHCFIKGDCGLSRLKGSSGFFENTDAKGRSDEIPGKPVLWMPDRLKENVSKFRQISSMGGLVDINNKRLKLLNSLQWEDRLAIAFPKLSRDVSTLRLTEVWDLIKSSKEDLEVFLKNLNLNS